MKGKLFGTDGVRGTANNWPMTADVALKIGCAAGQHFTTASKRRHKAVIAKDTRLSGYMLEPALVAGLTSAGMDVILVGPLPTPAVAMLTRSMRADMGIMLSASHNPFGDNGIKLFGPDGHKLSKEVEAAIETAMETGEGLAAPEKLGRAQRLEDARGRYIEFAKATFPKNLTLDGLTIVLDCANGAAYQVAPIVLRELGAKVIALSVDPDGFNINAECGSTYPKAMREAVVQHGADLGIALDGDADRVVMCDEQGTLLNGDQLLAIIATAWQQNGRLKGGGLVATQMSNLGMERYIASLGLQMERTKVGDRYVMERMQTGDYNVGGEQSGHIILSDYSTTGDGLVAALQVISLAVERRENLSTMSRLYAPMPQILKNVRYTGVSPLKKPEVLTAIEEGEAMLEGKGRVLVRVSGTEPLIRVMVEGEDESRIRQVAEAITKRVEQTA